MRHLFILFFLTLLFVNPTSKVQAQENTDNTKISILTCSPGLELYSLFGHSAIRIQDPARRMDVVFNYGNFDFNTPNFYVKFIRGKLKYNLTANRFRDFKAAYKRDKRSVVEQELNLDSISKQKLIKALWENYRPENRYYSYDFLFNNCSTLIRDILPREANDKIEFENPNQKSNRSFRDLLNLYLKQTPWIYTGIHLVLSQPCDAKATNYQEMFLPDMLKSGFDHCQITMDNQTSKLVSNENVILSETAIQPQTPWYLHPTFIFGLIAFIGFMLTLSSIKNKKRFVLLDVLVFGSTSLLGFVILFLWFFTDHQAMGPNWNILWALPIHLPLIPVLFKKNRPAWVKPYFKYHSIFLLVFIAAWPILPQSLPYTILPFVVLILIRSIFNATRS
ncbi:uncharacterized protein DUF4105 [Ancylomarina subtilis]|uniref:Uncharacterized protein DUF4105 n=1 Tax=Ancylomarina subtilis TaxID=1639035 RepID=A0A4Q7VHM8_9BACT|nr:DUF4105 domain-containing protein [Ancylomarina subtilis]RZT95610.1 uncharacterized protein DUF4105 [Ancylomarina subtilis]